MDEDTAGRGAGGAMQFGSARFRAGRDVKNTVINAGRIDRLVVGDVATGRAGATDAGAAAAPVYTVTGNAIINNYFYAPFPGHATAGGAADPARSLPAPPRADRDYYNLFVMGSWEDNGGRPPSSFALPTDRCLTYTSEKTRGVFTPLEDRTVIEHVMALPSLLLAEDEQYGRPGDGQMAYYGFVHGVRVYENEVKFQWRSCWAGIPQTRIGRILTSLQIDDGSGLRWNGGRFHELSTTHWPIKRCDLARELADAGFPVPDTGDDRR